MTATDTAVANLRWCDAIMDRLAAAGVRQVVVSPGSRSTPLVLAADRHPDLSTHVQVDERCAGFFALGLARGEAAPVALICTSGSALANWFPAALEASQVGVALIFVSADRPANLRGRGANQTVWQPGMFGRYARASVDLPLPGAPEVRRDALLDTALAAALGADPGPVQINVPLDEPLVPGVFPSPGKIRTRSPARAVAVCEPESLNTIARRFEGTSGVIVAGPMAPNPSLAGAVVALAMRLGWPVLADPLSNLRCGSHDRTLICGLYDTWLRNLELPVEQVLHLGAAPVSKVLLTWMSTHERVQVRPWGEFYTADGREPWEIRADEAGFCESLAAVIHGDVDRRGATQATDAEARVAARIEVGDELPVQARLVSAMLAELPAGSALFLGNSLAVREVDWFMTGRQPDLTVFGNRGASGIDGNVSTAMGLARAWPGPTLALLGDLALYHDMNGLLAAAGIDAVLLVINNGGGGIFQHLPQAQLESFPRYWLTPTGLSIARIADLYGLRYSVCAADDPGAAIRAALGRPGVDLLELDIDARLSAEAHRRWWSSGVVRN